MDEKKKQSLLRYVAVMFVAAFVLVAISLVGQTRSIGQLSQNSASALQKAQELQDTNRKLTQELEEAAETFEELQSSYLNLLEENETLKKDLSAAEQTVAALEEQMKILEESNSKENEP